MQVRQNRRKGPTPIANRRSDDVLDRTLRAMGLEPLRSHSSSPGAGMGPSNLSYTPEPAALSHATKSKRITLLDLPPETQKNIFGHSSPSDLLALSLVSKHFRDIATEHLYRSFHIAFPEVEDSLVDHPIDALAGGLDTFVTSDYDYAKYLREIILEPTCGAEHAEHSYRNYLSDVSCGKFLNTLLLLTLRKSKSLETFKWDIRVEPSRQVFKALHEISALQHLHIRLHAGHSTYNPPPSLTASSDISNNAPPPLHPHPHPHFAFSPVHSVPMVHVQPPNVTYSGPPGNQFVVGSNIASKGHQKVLKSALPSRKFLPTFSGFRKLKTLAVLDMDTHDYISEIRECIRYSSSTLKTLKLSFSESLASSSRKPPPELHSDDESDQEDDFAPLVPQPPGVPPPGIPASNSTDGATKALQAQEEKKKQEAVLARIFGFDPDIPKPPPFTIPGPEKKPVEDPKKIFMRNLAPLGKFLLTIIKDEDEQSEVAKEALSVITKASKLFVDAVEGKLSDTKPAVGSSQSSAIKTAPDAPTRAADDGSNAVSPVTGAVERGLFDDPEPDRKQEAYSDGDMSNPDDIDIEAPELAESTSELGESSPEVQQDADEAIDDTGAKPTPPRENVGANNGGNSLSEGENSVDDVYSNYRKEKMRLNQEIEAEMDNWEKIISMGPLGLVTAQRMFQGMEAYVDNMLRLELNSSSKLGDGRPTSVANQAARMSEYVRTTRGLTLHTLAIYLIPIRASVLTKAIDIHVLRDITLLDVGPQHAFWVLAAKENKVSPLPLRKIYTDNVSMQFMILVNQLDRIDELILLERKQNALLESSTPKTMITMEQIRRIVLKKHASTLKVLMLRNDDSLDWDLNIKSTILLCQRAKQLEELAVKFGTRTMHTLLQFMPGLTNLRALHTLQFRHEDSCVWVMREFRKFTVDTVSHNPDMKLEYLALEDMVERLVRRTPKKVDKKGKGKEKAGAGKGKSLAELALLQNGIPQNHLAGSNSLLKLGIAASLALDAGESEDEDLEVGGKMGLRVETMEDIHFSDIPGVRIFEKGVLYDRL